MENVANKEVSNGRGAFIVFEGCDKSGKTTQSKKIVEYLQNNKISAKYINFPKRDTPSGQLINAYLTNKEEMSDETIHLLFTVNRWEAMNEMKTLLLNGTTLIVDRYSYSGIVFSAAKGLKYEWCKAPETGLLKPDKVIYLKAPTEELSSRSEYGTERYEKVEFQKKVERLFDDIMKDEGDYCLQVNASQDLETLQHSLRSHVLETISLIKNTPLHTLWSCKGDN